MRFFLHFICLPLMVVALIWLGVVLAIKNNEIADLQHELNLVTFTADARKDLVEEARVLQRVFGLMQVMKLTVTAYNATPAQTDEDPEVSASMRKVRPGTIAVSRDLFDRGWVFGRKVRIEGLGIFEINDLMNARHTKSIDIFLGDQGKAVEFGRREYKVALLSI